MSRGNGWSSIDQTDDSMDVDQSDGSREFRPRTDSNSSGNNNDARIVADLMSYSVLPDSESTADKRGFQETAIRSLVRRLRRAQERNALGNLIRAVQTRDRETACIRIPRSLDGRMQVRQKKTIPHVLYCQIWRWNDLKTYHELQGIVTCRYAYDLPSDMSQASGEICVNPYHYERIANNIQRRRFNEYHDDRFYEVQPSNYEGFRGHTPRNGLAQAIGSVHSDRPNSFYVAPNADNNEGFIEVPSNPDSNVMVLSLEPVSRPSVSDSNSDFAGGGQAWGRIFYYELKDRCSDFDVYTNEISIDNGTHPYLPNRFCVGNVSNFNRTDQIERIRVALGRGVKLTGGSDNQDVFLENLSQQKIFVQSAIWNASDKQDPALIRSIESGTRQRIFNKQTFSQKLLEATYTNDYTKVADMVNDCKVRVSFVKGWGSRYQRTHIDSCECWFEIQMLQCLSWLDHVLGKMAPPEEVSSGSHHPAPATAQASTSKPTSESTK